MLTHGEADAELPSYEDDVARLAVRLRAGSEGDHRADPADPADPQPAASRSGHGPLDVDDRGLEGRRRSPGQDLLRGPQVPVRLRGRSHPPARGAVRPAGRQVRGGVLRGGHAADTTGSRCSPIDVTRDGQTISVRFHVPNPPLAWDEAFGAPHQFVHAGLEERARVRGRGSGWRVTITDAVDRRRHVRIGSTGCPTRPRRRWSCATR